MLNNFAVAILATMTIAQTCIEGGESCSVTSDCCLFDGNMSPSVCFAGLFCVRESAVATPEPVAAPVVTPDVELYGCNFMDNWCYGDDINCDECSVMDNKSYQFTCGAGDKCKANEQSTVAAPEPVAAPLVTLDVELYGCGYGDNMCYGQDSDCNKCGVMDNKSY